MNKKLCIFNSLSVPGPTITEESRPFWEAAALGRFQIQRCDECSLWVFYPRSICPGCWSHRLSWYAASGEALLESFSIIESAGHPGWRSVTPYTLGIVKLLEGPTMLTTLIEIEADSIQIGMLLKVRFVQVGSHFLPMFTSADVDE